MTTGRAGREIAHGRLLATRDAEVTWGWGTPAGRRRARRRGVSIAVSAGLGRGERVLEIGCGSGLFTEMFAETGAEIVAVDISPELLGLARARGLPPERVTFREGRFEDLGVDGSFDAVVGSSVLHHLELGPALRQIRRLLKPGGLLAFAEPNMLNPQVFLERRLRWLPMFSYTSPDETAFVRPALARTLRRAGFEDVAITPFDWLHPKTPPSLIAPVLRLGAALERLPVARELSGSLLIRARRS